MKENFEIQATSRDVQGKGASRRLRREGLVPGIIYGGDTDPKMINLRHNELIQHLENESFYSHIIKVDVEGSVERAVLKDLQRHPAKPFIMHIDFLRVGDNDRIKMHVPLHFINENTAPGVKAGGSVSHAMTDVEVICAAKDLPEFIEVDLGEMNAGDAIHLSELKMPEGVEVLALTHEGDHDTGVVSIHAAKGGSDEAEETAEEA